jgi:hypothetical protein
MRNRILVHGYDNPYSHYTLGKSFYVDFKSYNEDPGQYEIVSAEDDPLVGTNIQFNSETIVPYGKNLLFFPIPFEMLETYEEKPQMLVEIDDMPAVCHSMDCGFMHIPAVGEITEFTAYLSGAFKTVTIKGTNLPDNVSKIQSIKFADSTCTPIPSDEVAGTLSDTEVVCMLDREPVCGNWKPKLTTFFGDVPVAEAVSAKTV